MLSKTKNPPQTETAERGSQAAAVSALRKLTPSQADMQSAAALLLSGDSKLSVRPSHLDPSPCFQSANGISFQIVDAAGRAMITHTDDLEIICSALDTADPLLRAIETALSVHLEPTDIQPISAADSPVVLAVKMANIGVDNVGVNIAIPTGHANAPLWIQSAAQIAPSAADTPCVLQLHCTAAYLSIAEASDLSGGDMVMLACNLAMQMQAGPASLQGVFDVNSGLFLAGAQPVKLERSSQMSDNDPSGNDPSVDSSPFNVPVSIRLPDQMVSMETLAALKPGTNLPIGPLLQGLPVELMIAGKRLASGEIVQIGDNFAVLIEERGPISEPARAQESAMDDDGSAPPAGEE